MRHFLLIFLFIATPLAFAAPVPKDGKEGKLTRLYGKPVDPDKRCEFSLEGEDLIVKMSAELNASAVSLKGAPRTALEISGNFEAVVAVKYTSEKTPGTDAVGGHLGGGLAIWETEDVCFLINRHHWPSVGAANGSNWSGGFDVHGTTKGTTTSHGATCGEVPLDRATHLKLRRVGNTIASAESRDGGKTWNPLTEGNHEFANTLNLGICVFNTTSSKGTVTFSGLLVTALPAK